MKKILSIVLAVVLMITALPLGAFELKASALSYVTDDGFIYTVNTSTYEITITGIESYVSGDIEIPAYIQFYYDIYTVTAIGYRAFYNCTEITSVYMPDTITSVKSEIFRKCTGLQSVRLSNNLTTISASMFADCSELYDITLPSSITVIGSSAFSGCECIGDKYGNLTIPYGVTTISSNAFRNCYSLQSVYIPSTVTTIDAGVFSGCDNLYTIEIDANNSNYNSGICDDCIINTSTNELIQGTPFTIIPEDGSVTLIAQNAFARFSTLYQIFIPDGIYVKKGAFASCEGLVNIYLKNCTLQDGAFSSCKGLENVTIYNAPSINLGNGFSSCSAIQNVYFMGSEAEKSNIITNNSNLLQATWHYNSCVGAAQHTYSNSCDNQCNIVTCEFIRSITHTYTNACDKDCNICGIVRTVPDHVFSNACDNSCNVCGFTREVPAHIYDNACDSYCNICNYKRNVPDHVYSNDCDTTCNECDCTRVVYHFYDNACDTTCNECEYTRTIKHTYDNACDADCNICGFIREVPDHIYSNACDTDCNVCKLVREVPDHIYSGDCDAFCNECSLERTVLEIHTYSNNCDKNCNICSFTREVPDHIYSDTCDTKCNECGYERSITHTYDNACDAVCNICGYERTPDVHKVKAKLYSFENASNYPFALNDDIYSSTNKINSSSATATINISKSGSIKISYYTSTEKNYDKLIIKHNNTTKVTVSGTTNWADITINVVAGDRIYITYSKDSSSSSGSDTVYFKLDTSANTPAEDIDPTCTGDIICDVCGVVVKPALDHTYSNACDKSCNVCGATRTVPAHIYDNTCDTSCNECGATRSVTHTYDNTCDTECNICGNVRTITHTYSSDNDLQCNVCNAVRYITYTITDGKATITGMDKTVSGTITLPTVIEGCDVTAIGDKAFNSCEYLTVINLPKTLTSIGSYAFYGTGIYNITIPEGVTKIGTFAFSNCYVLMSINIPSTVTSIGTGAFLNCYKISNINVSEDNTAYCTIDGSLFNKAKTTLITYARGKSVSEYVVPEGVTTIGNSAFKNCTGVKSVIFPESLTTISTEAFSNCSGLTSLVFPKNLTSIGTKAFYYCQKITSLTIPKSVKSIGENAFLYSSGITDVYYMGSESDFANLTINATGNTTLTDATWHYNSCLGATEHIYDNGCDAFCNICETKRDAEHIYDDDNDIYCNECNENRYIIYTITNGEATVSDINTALSGEVVIPETLGGCPVVAIGDYAFNGGVNVTSVIIPNSVKTIGNYAFYNCGITTITLPEGVTKVGNYAFANSTSLTEINLPASVTAIGTAVVLNCSKVKNINVNDQNDNYSSVDGVLFNKDKTIIYIYPQGKTAKTYTIPDGVVTIASSAFKNCTGLTSVIFPNSLTTIGIEAFSNCSGITKLVIPESVKRIESKAFYFCKKLSSITLTKNLVLINTNAFLYCSSITDVYYMGTKNEYYKLIIYADGNTTIKNAAWHYNSCIDAEEHTYDNAYDADCNICGGIREVADYVAGDIDGTGVVDLNDVTNIARYFAGWDVDVNDSALDVDGDGLVNLNDLIHLAQYVAGWDVELV